MSLLDGVSLDALTEEQRPTCNPCKAGACWRCPRVLDDEGIIESDFDCDCYRRDPEEHAAARMIHEEERDDDWGGEF